MLKHRAASPGAGSVLGGLLRNLKQLIARFQLDQTLSDSGGGSGRHTLWPSDGFAICAVSRHWCSIVGDWTSSSPRNGANRKRLAIFPFQPLAVALLRLPSTINRTRVFPQSLATISNTETRDRGLKTCGAVRCHQVIRPRSRASAFRLWREIKGPSVLCRRLPIVQERDRGRW